MFNRAISIVFLFLHWQHYWHPYRKRASCHKCFVLSLHSGIWCSCRMSIQSCYFCVQDEDKFWFWMCLRQVLTLCHFCCCVLGVFNSPVATPAHGLLGLNPSRWLRFISENASKLALYFLCHHHRLLTQALFFGPCHCSYVFVPCLAFRVHFAGDLNKTMSFVVGVLSTSFALYSGPGPALGGWLPRAWTLGPQLYNTLHLTHSIYVNKNIDLF